VTITAALSEAETSRYAQLGDIRIHYHDVGEGPVLVMLHGGGAGASGWSNFKQNLPVLTRDHRVLLVDQPGFGRSDKPVHDEPQHELTTGLLIQLLDELAIPNITPVGNSMGGAAALEFTLTHPDRVERLILMAPAGGALPITSQLSAEAKMLVAYYAPPGPSLERTRELAEALTFRGETDEATIRERYEAAIDPAAAAYNIRMFTNWARTGPQHWRRLAEIEHETLIMWGREDKVLPLDACLHMLHQIRNARLVVFPNCGHWCQVEAQEEFEQQIITFLAAGRPA
jgi:pimeloyl-ACP methyl ester carboxylesterase